jgi:hypothetical protein
MNMPKDKSLWLEGYLAGVEASAKYHEAVAATFEAAPIRDADGEPINGAAISADLHRKHAAAIRALVVAPMGPK